MNSSSLEIIMSVTMLKMTLLQIHEFAKHAADDMFSFFSVVLQMVNQTSSIIFILI